MLDSPPMCGERLTQSSPLLLASMDTVINFWLLTTVPPSFSFVLALQVFSYRCDSYVSRDTCLKAHFSCNSYVGDQVTR